MRFVPIAQDGNCMYRAVGQSYHAITTGALASPAAETSMATNLRHMVAEYVQAHPSVVLNTPEYVIFEHRPVDARALVHHLVREIKGGRWGENLELGILQHVLRHPIKVYHPDGKTFWHGLPIPEENTNIQHAEPICVVYHGDVHYDGLVPDDTRNPSNSTSHPKTHPRTPSLKIAKTHVATPSKPSLSDSEAKAFHHKLHRNVYIDSLKGLGANQTVLNWARNLPLQDLKNLHANQRGNMLHALSHGDPEKRAYHSARNKRAFMLHNLEARRNYAEAMGHPVPTLTPDQHSKLVNYARIMHLHRHHNAVK